MIWDLHCHPAGFGGRTPEEAMTELIRLMDLMGIERTCIYLASLLHYDPDPAQLRQHNDWILQALQHWNHRAFGFAYLNPNHVEASLDEIKRCVRDGPMKGIKLWVARRCSAPELNPIIEAAAAQKAVIFQHTWIKTTGNLPGESSPMDLAVLAARYPEVPMICGHTGGTWWQGIRAIRAHRNVSVDLAGSDPTNGFTEMAVRELGAARVLWGSDSSGRSLGSQLAKVHGAVIPEAAKRLILGENLKRMITT
jgi:predicted TIM-barrel fold metal-dependent hydrolase